MKQQCVWAMGVLALSVAMTSKSAGPDGLVESCNGCHGDQGVSQWNEVPTIAGIDAFVHSDALWLYKEEGRPCANSAYKQGDTSRPETTMCDIAAALSEDQIEELAAHYAALPFVAAAQSFDPALASAGMVIHERECKRCHSDGGSNPDDEASILAGQWMGYLAATFEEYASGARAQPDKMKEKLDPLSASDKQALLHYYASQQ